MYFICQFAYSYYSEEYLKDMPTVLVEADKEHKGNYLAFEVDGDSMEPEYFAGDIVICREVKRDLWQYKLHYKEWDFVIAHGTKGIMLKEITDHNVETGEITCHSLNADHADFILNLGEITYLFNVVEHRRSGKAKRRSR
ncbi:Peptidase S24-like [Chryseobacterium sp. RU37D]|uniref:S24 family peptidase n=1 Tax=Chryseobacterium sp. RU37D TaxID=1907397 RepID=UPI0009574362|nr:S24 family peptidase [Chryseobacterium sp. RU37D]SIQ69964.1 Peptidase S24-like [Chryseobacterium sp. RU37D]